MNSVKFQEKKTVFIRFGHRDPVDYLLIRTDKTATEAFVEYG
jgi:hypothetical protein